MAKLEIDPVLAAAASFYKRLTTPDSEDWNVIVDGEPGSPLQFRKSGTRMAALLSMAVTTSCRWFKKTVKELPADHYRLRYAVHAARGIGAAGSALSRMAILAGMVSSSL